MLGYCIAMNRSTAGEIDKENKIRVKYLATHNLTQGLRKQDIASLAQQFHTQIIPAHTTFIFEDSSPNYVYIIVSGGVRIYVTTSEGKDVTISLLGPNEILGELAYLDEAKRSANVQTIKDTEMLAIRGDHFQKIIVRYPIVTMNLLTILAQRMRHSHQQLKDIVTTSLSNRVFKTLSVLEKYFPKGEINLSHEDLAMILGATRPRVTEALHTLKKSGKIDLNRHKICFSNSFSREQT